MELPNDGRGDLGIVDHKTNFSAFVHGRTIYFRDLPSLKAFICNGSERKANRLEGGEGATQQDDPLKPPDEPNGTAYARYADLRAFSAQRSPLVGVLVHHAKFDRGKIIAVRNWLVEVRFAGIGVLRFDMEGFLADLKKHNAPGVWQDILGGGRGVLVRLSTCVPQGDQFAQLETPEQKRHRELMKRRQEEERVIRPPVPSFQDDPIEMKRSTFRPPPPCPCRGSNPDCGLCGGTGRQFLNGLQ